jgi:hypothetical protein
VPERITKTTYHHHADRQRRYRLRQKNGELAVTITMSQDETTKLHRRGYLGEHELEDREAIAEAVVALIADLVVDDP